MTSTVSPSSSILSRAPTRPPAGTPGRSRRGMHAPGDNRSCRSSPAGARRRRPGPLGCYADTRGRRREVIAGRRGDGSVLVVDRDALTLGDRRLVAHLAPDEPAGNATLVCAHYLRDASRGRCRQVTAEDLAAGPAAESPRPRPGAPPGEPVPSELLGPNRGTGASREIYAFRLESVDRNGILELRWRRHLRRGTPAVARTVCLREAVGTLESYEPACELTHKAIAAHGEDTGVSATILRSELERLRESPIVLNRKLRQAVLVAVEHQGLSMSEIALRCGRVKRDAKGNASGETSWLARRVGILPESGTDCPTPWVHSDVLALIARNGLGISPREVELG